MASSNKRVFSAQKNNVGPVQEMQQQQTVQAPQENVLTCANDFVEVLKRKYVQPAKATVSTYRTQFNHMQEANLVDHFCNPQYVLDQFITVYQGKDDWQERLASGCSIVAKHLNLGEKVALIRRYAGAHTSLPALMLRHFLNSKPSDAEIGRQFDNTIAITWAIGISEIMKQKKALKDVNGTRIAKRQKDNAFPGEVVDDKVEAMKPGLLQVLGKAQPHVVEVFQHQFRVALLLMLYCGVVLRQDVGLLRIWGEAGPGTLPDLTEPNVLDLEKRMMIFKKTNKQKYCHKIRIPDEIWPYVEALVEVRRKMGQTFLFMGDRKLRNGKGRNDGRYLEARSFGQSFAKYVGQLFNKPSVGNQLLRFIKNSQELYKFDLHLQENQQKPEMRAKLVEIARTFDHSVQMMLLKYNGCHIIYGTPATAIEEAPAPSIAEAPTVTEAPAVTEAEAPVPEPKQFKTGDVLITTDRHEPKWLRIEKVTKKFYQVSFMQKVYKDDVWSPTFPIADETHRVLKRAVPYIIYDHREYELWDGLSVDTYGNRKAVENTPTEAPQPAEEVPPVEEAAGVDVPTDAPEEVPPVVEAPVGIKPRKPRQPKKPKAAPERVWHEGCGWSPCEQKVTKKQRRLDAKEIRAFEQANP